MRTNKQIEYWYGSNHKMIIPMDTPVVPATNLPDPNQYWVEPWLGMDEYAESYQRNYGFLVQADEVYDETIDTIGGSDHVLTK